MLYHEIAIAYVKTHFILYNLFYQFFILLQRFNRAFGDASGMTVILDEPRLVADKADAAPLEVREGAIDFEDIGFWYTDGDARTRVFDGLDLHIPAGQRVGLVGASGAGKTTLTKLLLRLSDIQEGRILVDGQDISDTTQQSLRRQIAYCLLYTSSAGHSRKGPSMRPAWTALSRIPT